MVKKQEPQKFQLESLAVALVGWAHRALSVCSSVLRSPSTSEFNVSSWLFKIAFQNDDVINTARVSINGR